MRRRASLEKAMNIALWVLQVLLAVAFAAHGWLVLAPPPEIAAQMEAALPRAFWVFLGIAEIAAAIGLTLPGIMRILPGLVPAAAAGVMFVMICATVWHVARAEYSSAVITLVLLAMATFTAYGRWRLRPIRPRQAA
jgi:uncharacterized membrane protein YphA (DoxX/SURF4 family)